VRANPRLQIRVWSLATGECECTLSGHRGAVSALRFSPSGALLASGSRDTDVVLWDVVAEAGLYRLRGHRDQVTGVAFLGGAGAGRLASCAKDELLKVWDLDTQHCCQTVVGHRGEVWAMDVDPSGTRLATGATDAEVRLYKVDADAGAGAGAGAGGAGGDGAAAGAGGGGGGAVEVLTPMGSLRRAASERAATVRFGAAPGGGVLLACQGAGRVTEVWRLRGEAEAKKRQKRRQKRRQEKKGKKAGAAAGGSGSEGEEEERPTAAAGRALAAAEAAEAAEEEARGLTAGDEFELVGTVRSKHKARGAAFCPPSARRAAPARLLLALANNSLEVWELDAQPGAGAGGGGGAARAQVVDAGGHRSDVRCLALSSDDALCLSGSSSGVKVWNPRSGGCVRTIESGYALCAVWAPGNRHAVVGTKAGTLEVIEVGASARVAVVQAHEGPVW
jgi:U3 small nucleolar RNA-associated protein 12